jgi:LysR family transcriptional regulator for metE and metH
METIRRRPLYLDVRDLRLVEAIGRHGTVTKAALALHLTQSAVSHQLADLEGRVGAPLFERGQKRMQVTPVGEQLLRSAERLLLDLARAEEDLRTAVAGRQSVLRLSTECYTCYHWLPAVLASFEERFPRVEARIAPEATSNPLQALLREEIDLAIMSSTVRDRRLAVTPLFDDELVAVVHPAHPWAKRRFVVAADFANEHLIAYTVHESDSYFIRDVLAPAGAMPRQSSEVQLTEAILELVKANLGVAVLARWAVAHELETGVLRPVSITAQGLQRQWKAVTRRLKSTPRHLSAFVELVQREAFPARFRKARRSA